MRMGWMDSPQKARGLLNVYSEFAKQVRASADPPATWYWGWEVHL